VLTDVCYKARNIKTANCAETIALNNITKTYKTGNCNKANTGQTIKRRPVRQYLYESEAAIAYNSSVMAAAALAVTILTICSVTGAELPSVAVQQGTLQGIHFKTVWDKECLAFLGIRYAKPPVGDLRFRVRYSSISCSTLALLVIH
jgi:hypothetical protein